MPAYQDQNGAPSRNFLMKAADHIKQMACLANPLEVMTRRTLLVARMAH
jgi:hypothetical protein